MWRKKHTSHSYNLIFQKYKKNKENKPKINCKKHREEKEPFIRH